MIDFIVWASRLTLFVALGYGWPIMQADTSRLKYLYLTGWLGYISYSFIFPSDLSLNRVIPITCLTATVAALVIQISKLKNRP